MAEARGEQKGMFKTNRMHFLLLAIFAFAFVYRIALLLWQTYPPGSDIGFHAGVINSITQPGNTNFLYNFYQMGGGVELEFPGYHIFAAEIVLLTGLPSYLAQAFIVAFFSSLIVVAIFLVTRMVWSEFAAFIAALFVAISRFDIEILCWGGYPNIVALLLIPLTFYLFLKKDKLTPAPFLVSTSFLVASILLTHSLSAAVFLSITGVTLLFSLLFPKAFGARRTTVLYWVLPLFIGAVLVSPFLASAAPHYLNESSLFSGATAVGQALLVYRAVPLEMTILLFACVVPLFFFSKKYQGRFLWLPTFLLLMWLLLPLLMTQDYLVGLYMDSVRFLYYLIYPAIIISAVATAYAAYSFGGVFSGRYGSKRLDKKEKPSFNKPRLRIFAFVRRKAVYTTLTAVFLVILFVGLPMFRFPWEAVKVHNFYQVMNNSGYEAIQWARQNTPLNSMFAADFHYGWWLAGVGQRPTISNVDLQALSLAREVDISRNVSYLLDTDYAIDNGYLQVREDGGYTSRNNPLIEADINWTYAPYPFVHFNNDNITLAYRSSGSGKSMNISEIPVTKMQLSAAQTQSPSIIVNRANNDLSCSETLTLSQGLKFVNITFVLQVNSPLVSLDALNFMVEAKGLVRPTENMLTVLDVGNNACTQLIFAESQPEVSIIDVRYPCVTELAYHLQGKSAVEVQILAGLYMVSTDEMISMDQFNQLPAVTAQTALTPSAGLPIIAFDYRKALQDYDISYIANRNFEVNPKFASDPTFSLVFSNSEVAFFRVETPAAMGMG